MEAILSKLSEIENAASRILERTAEQKKAIAEEMRVRTEEYDQGLEAEQNQRMEAERESLHRLSEEKLDDIRTSMEAQIRHLDEQYEKRHEALAKEILARILEG